jgi:hypothetical protein
MLNQVTELLKEKGLLPYVSTTEIMVYTQMWLDFMKEGATDEIRNKFKSFDKVVEDRKSFDTYVKKMKEREDEQMENFKLTYKVKQNVI